MFFVSYSIRSVIYIYIYFTFKSIHHSKQAISGNNAVKAQINNLNNVFLLIVGESMEEVSILTL